jgi:glutamate synthase (NADPH) small chain
MMERDRASELATRCIRDEAPLCSAACPVHADVRAMATAIGNSDFGGAFALLAKAVIFPRIVARVCERPCEGACTRGELGGSISIGALERACCEFAQKGGTVARLAHSKKQRIAVVGGGLSGLAAASTLALQGYRTVLFEAEWGLGGRLSLLPESALPREAVASDLALPEALGVEIRLGARVGAFQGCAASLFSLRDEFDAVYLAPGCGPDELIGRKFGLDAQGRMAVDPVTYATDLRKVFAGGSRRLGLGGLSFIASISDGRRAAVSIDQFLSKVPRSGDRGGIPRPVRAEI